MPGVRLRLHHAGTGLSWLAALVLAFLASAHSPHTTTEEDVNGLSSMWRFDVGEEGQVLRGGQAGRYGRSVHQLQQPPTQGHGTSITIYSLSSDGVAPTPMPTATPIPIPTATPELRKMRTIPDIICSEPWPCEQAIAVARCESGLNPNAVNPYPVYLNGQENHAEGLFQLLIPLHTWRLHFASPFDPEANTAAAYQLWTEAGWSPWKGPCYP